VVEPLTGAALVKKGGADQGVCRQGLRRSGPGTREWAADHIRFKRWKAQVKRLEKAQKHAEKAGIDPQAVPRKVLVPLLESGSLEDDEGMVEKWAALLANAAGSADAIPPGFPEILKELSPIEAAILDDIYRLLVEEKHGDWKTEGVVARALKERFGLDEDQYQVHIDNLYRLRLCSPPTTRLAFTDQPDTPYQTDSKDWVRITHLGRAFVEACRPPTDAGSKSALPV
jgi:abortive infection alpha-like protein